MAAAEPSPASPRTRAGSGEPGPGRVGPPPLPDLPEPWRIRVLRSHGPDLALVHGWMRKPHVAAAWDQAWAMERWAEELSAQLAGAVSRPCVASYSGEPIAYLELYRAARDVLAAHYPARPHDLGVHIAIGEVERIGCGLGRQLLRAIADSLLAADSACTRIVAEPNVDNVASIRAFSAAGFRRTRTIRLPDKSAALMVRPRTAADLPWAGEKGSPVRQGSR